METDEKKVNKQTVSFTMTRELNERLEAYASKLGISKSSVVTLALQDYIKQDKEQE